MAKSFVGIDPIELEGNSYNIRVLDIKVRDDNVNLNEKKTRSKYTSSNIA